MNGRGEVVAIWLFRPYFVKMERLVDRKLLEENGEDDGDDKDDEHNDDLDSNDDGDDEIWELLSAMGLFIVKDSQSFLNQR